MGKSFQESFTCIVFQDARDIHQDIRKHVVVVTNMESEVNKEIGKAREAGLKRGHVFQTGPGQRSGRLWTKERIFFQTEELNHELVAQLQITLQRLCGWTTKRRDESWKKRRGCLRKGER
jgi:hypothetical protein